VLYVVGKKMLQVNLPCLPQNFLSPEPRLLVNICQADSATVASNLLHIARHQEQLWTMDFGEHWNSELLSRLPRVLHLKSRLSLSPITGF